MSKISVFPSTANNSHSRSPHTLPATILTILSIFALTVGFSSCDLLFPPEKIDGTARLLLLEVVNARNPNIADYAADATIVSGSTSGTVSAFLPGGSSKTIDIEFTVADGSLKAGGTTLSSPATIDLNSVSTLVTVDSLGNEYSYTLDIGETGLPSVFITTQDGAEIVSKDDYIDGTVTIAGGNTNYSTPFATMNMKIRGRGNSTWGAPKKPYRFKFTSVESVLGMPAAAEWVLLANYFDKALMRNAVAMKTAETLFSDTLGFIPRMKFVDVYLNGSYNGSYTLGDQIEVGTSRVNIGASSTTETDTAYLLEVNRWIKTRDGGILGTDYFETAQAGVVVEYKTPKASKITQDQKNWLSTRFADIETRLKDGGDFGEYLDVDSFIDWAIIEELFRNTDSAFISSIYLHRTGGGKFRIGPLWDFDLSAGNAEGTVENPGLRSTSGLEAITTDWLNWMHDDPTTRTAFKNRWADKKGQLYTTVMGNVAEFKALTAKSAAQDAQKWALSVDTWPNAFPTGLSRNEYIELYSDWLDDRYDWLDEAISGNDF
jgi:hypothetical protein